MNKRKNPKLFCVRFKKVTSCLLSSLSRRPGQLRWRRPPLQALALFLYSYLLDRTEVTCWSSRISFWAHWTKTDIDPQEIQRGNLPILNLRVFLILLMAEILRRLIVYYIIIICFSQDLYTGILIHVLFVLWFCESTVKYARCYFPTSDRNSGLA